MTNPSDEMRRGRWFFCLASAYLVRVEIFLCKTSCLSDKISLLENFKVGIFSFSIPITPVDFVSIIYNFKPLQNISKVTFKLIKTLYIFTILFYC